MGKIKKYFRGVGEEARRIRWPNGKTLFKSVMVVLVITIVTALSLALFDFLSAEIEKSFENAFPKKDTSGSSGEATSQAVEMLIYGIKNFFLRIGGK